MTPLVIIQAQTDSRGLPGKAMLSFRGMPMAVLAARRAASRGAEVVLVTSKAASDDLLSDTVSAAGIAVVRGDKDDLLGQFLGALGESSDIRPVVLSKADNILPDGDLITEIVAALEAGDCAYINTIDQASGLPRGLDMEVMRAGCLRAAAGEARDILDRTHATAWIRKTYRAQVFDRYAELNLTAYRVTVDNLDDLLSLHRVFPSDGDPVAVPWREVLPRLGLGSFQPRSYVARGDLVLGTAQLGMAYGINRCSEPVASEGQDMIRHAISSGVNWIDTARDYGASEDVLGGVLAQGWLGRAKVVTKLSALAGWTQSDSPKGARTAAEASLLASRVALRMSRLDTVMLHRWKHWTDWQGAVAALLRDWQANGLITTLGASVQSPEELAEVLAEPAIGHIQMPLNLFDDRWNALHAEIQHARETRGLIVHTRSALLQGLLLSDNPVKWESAGVDDPIAIRQWLIAAATEHAGGDVSRLCLNWVRAVPWVDGVVVGMDSLDQLRANLEVFAGPVLSREACQALAADCPVLPRSTLNPATWRAA